MKKTTIKEYRIKHKIQRPEQAERFGLKECALYHRQKNGSMIFTGNVNGVKTHLLVKPDNIYKED